MATIYHYFILASTYGSGRYDTLNYNGTGAGGGGLSNTGIAVVGVMTAAAMLLLAAMVVRIWKRPGKRPGPEE